MRFQALKLYLEGLGLRSIECEQCDGFEMDKVYERKTLSRWKSTDVKDVSDRWFLALCSKKQRKVWIWVAILGQVLAIFCENRIKQSAKCIWKLIKTLQPKYIYTDNLASYREVLASEKHAIGKKHTQLIESINSSLFMQISTKN